MAHATRQKSNNSQHIMVTHFKTLYALSFEWHLMFLKNNNLEKRNYIKVTMVRTRGWMENNFGKRYRPSPASWGHKNVFSLKGKAHDNAIYFIWYNSKALMFLHLRLVFFLKSYFAFMSNFRIFDVPKWFFYSPSPNIVYESGHTIVARDF
jgi:hypothetical protein